MDESRDARGHRFITNRFGKRMSISAVSTCMKILGPMALFLIFLQVSVSILVIFSRYDIGISPGCVVDGNGYDGSLNIFYLDCWFPGALLGIVALISASLTYRHMSTALNEIEEREKALQSKFGSPVWDGLQMSGTFVVPIHILLIVLTAVLFVACSLSFGPALAVVSVDCILVYILSLVGLSSVLVLGNKCCQFNYPYPVYRTFDERPYMLYGPNGQKN